MNISLQHFVHASFEVSFHFHNTLYCDLSMPILTQVIDALVENKLKAAINLNRSSEKHKLFIIIYVKFR